MMRIITGSARGTHLKTLPGDSTRPTSERAKEAVFSMLGDAVRGARVLDLFGGSGQMGLEALSRGAAHATFVDNSREALAIIRDNAARTQLFDRAEIKEGEALAFLRAAETPYDIVFLDPPYAAGLLPGCLSLLLERRLLTPSAVVVCEAGGSDDFFAGNAAFSERFTVLRDHRYGAAFIRLLQAKQ